MDFRLIGEAGVFRRLKQGVIFRMADGVSWFHPVEGTEGLQLQAVSCYRCAKGTAMVGIPHAFAMDVSLEESVFSQDICGPPGLVVDSQRQRTIFALGIQPDILIVFPQMESVILGRTAWPKGKNAVWGRRVRWSDILRQQKSSPREQHGDRPEPHMDAFL